MYRSPNQSSAILPTASGSMNGATAYRTSSSPLARIIKSRVVRTLFLGYVAFCAVFTMKHIFIYQTKPEPVMYKHYELQRTYDPDLPYSVVSNLSSSVILSKMFTYNTPALTDNIKPFFIRAENDPDKDDITLATFVPQDDLSELALLADHFSGPISAVLHLDQPIDLPGTANPTINRLKTLLAGNAKLRKQVDIHLITTPQTHRQYVTMQQTNLHRNLARFFARTDFVMLLDADGSLPATDVTHQFNKFSPWMEKLRAGNVFVVPGFNVSMVSETAGESPTGANTGSLVPALKVNQIPKDKNQLKADVVNGKVVLSEKTWKKTIRNVDYNKWATQTRLGAIQNYDPYFAPTVIMRRDKMLWCPERFGNNQAACLFELYLSGVDFWMLPEDFTINVGTRQEVEMSEREKTITSRLYQKFQEESCLKHARAFYAAGEWESERARHCRISCQKVIAVWGLVIRQA
ncbi:hypothetical protein BGZ73_004110 [Actinomortierella ambigua]|nr:hypothetical protein BGZ73_004110 [Actinomortierella ambigua]